MHTSVIQRTAIVLLAVVTIAGVLTGCGDTIMDPDASLDPPIDSNPDSTAVEEDSVFVETYRDFLPLEEQNRWVYDQYYYVLEHGIKTTERWSVLSATITSIVENPNEFGCTEDRDIGILEEVDGLSIKRNAAWNSSQGWYVESVDSTLISSSKVFSMHEEGYQVRFDEANRDSRFRSIIGVPGTRWMNVDESTVSTTPSGPGGTSRTQREGIGVTRVTDVTFGQIAYGWSRSMVTEYSIGDNPLPRIRTCSL